MSKISARFPFFFEEQPRGANHCLKKRTRFLFKQKDFYVISTRAETIKFLVKVYQISQQWFTPRTAPLTPQVCTSCEKYAFSHSPQLITNLLSTTPLTPPAKINANKSRRYKGRWGMRKTFEKKNSTRFSRNEAITLMHENITSPMDRSRFQNLKTKKTLFVWSYLIAWRMMIRNDMWFYWFVWCLPRLLSDKKRYLVS